MVNREAARLACAVGRETQMQLAAIGCAHGAVYKLAVPRQTPTYARFELAVGRHVRYMGIVASDIS